MRESMPCSDCLAADQCIVPMPAVTLMRLSCVIYLPKMVHYRVLMSRPDLLNDPEHTDYALGVTARFGAEQVIAFVGLRRQPQIGIITASGRSCRIIDDHGATIDMNPGETHTCEIEYGRLRVFRVQS